ncbi:MAG: sialate O-acetylesterase [Eubacteriales bacterium]|nr:sialate O-acetylesterase [Eubacteriales bacterium]
MSTALRPAAVFGDHMVLRRDRPVVLFGEAEEGKRITAALEGRSVAATAREGRFQLRLPPMPAGGPHTLNITDGETTFTYTDVLFGEVYLAGGQSNMELELKNADDGARLTAEADYPLIRYYNVPKLPWLDEQALAAERQACWRAVAPGTCGDMSAVAFHFAARLQAELGVPVGVIDCYWGGTSAVCWLTEAALQSTVEGRALWTAFSAAIAAKTQAECEADVLVHDEAVDKWNKHIEVLRAEHPAMSWTEITHRVGPCPWGPPPSRKSGFRPAGLVETMVKRVAPYTLTGFLYYQGEEDAKHAGLYRALLSSLILCWRRLYYDETLPFLFVQLPMYMDSTQRDDRQWAVLREAQEQTYQSIRHTGMAVMIDGGELDNIHPTDKKTVGERLYHQALRVVYGRTGEAESPRAVAMYRDGEELVVSLSSAVKAEGEPALFEIGDETGVFRPAKARVTGTSLRLWAEGAGEPLTARYAWVNYGVVNVYGENGLPLAPFRITL